MPEAVVDVTALYAALDAKRQAERLSWRALAQRLEIVPSTFSRMADGRRPDVDTFASLLRWLGMPVESFMHATGAERGPETNSVETIGTYLRMDRNLTPEAATALEQLVKVAYGNLRKQHGDL